MRWTFLLLLVLNILYFAWQQAHPVARLKETPAMALQASEEKTLRLLSESTAALTKREAAPDLRETVCLYLGSFDEESEAARVEQRLLSLDIAAQRRGLDAQAGVDYWVYLPPLASRQASLMQLKELQARKIDSYLITQGDLANGISLGIFSRQDSANNVLQRLTEAGYTAQLRELPRAHRTYWLRVAPKSRRLLDDALLEQLSADFTGLTHQLMPCESGMPAEQ